MPPPKQYFGYNPKPVYDPNNQSIPINKLMRTVMGSANMQEQSIKQQKYIQHQNIDIQHTIHYTVWNAMKRLSAKDSFTPANELTP